MDIQQLRHLLAAADSGSYTQAAEQCDTSRQNIAHSVKKLEAEIGVALFQRQGNYMALTPAGFKVAQKAKDIVMRADGLYALCSTHEDERPMVVAISTNLFASMPEHTGAFFLQQSLKWRFVEHDCPECYKAVLSGKVDLAIVMCMERHFMGCVVTEVANSVAFALVSDESPLARQPFIEVYDLLDHDLVVMSDPAFQYAPLMLQLDAPGTGLQVVPSIITSTSTVLSLVRRRGVVALVSGNFAKHPPAGTVAVPFYDQRLNWHFYMLYRPDARNHHAISDFAHGLSEAFARDELEHDDTTFRRSKEIVPVFEQ